MHFLFFLRHIPGPYQVPLLRESGAVKSMKRQYRQYLCTALQVFKTILERDIQKRDSVDRAAVAFFVIEQTEVRSRSVLGLMIISVRDNRGIRRVIRIRINIRLKSVRQLLAEYGEGGGVKYMQGARLKLSLDSLDLLSGSLCRDCLVQLGQLYGIGRNRSGVVCRNLFAENSGDDRAAKYGAQLILEEMM